MPALDGRQCKLPRANAPSFSPGCVPSPRASSLAGMRDTPHTSANAVPATTQNTQVGAVVADQPPGPRATPAAHDSERIAEVTRGPRRPLP